MADNYANPLKGAETDITKATKAITGLLNPLNPKEEEVIGQQEPPKEQEEQNSPELTQEESSNEDQPQEQEIVEEESNKEASEDVSQDEEQIDTQEKQESPSYKVKVNGQEFDVTLDELRNGYSRDADYRQKTEELAIKESNFNLSLKSKDKTILKNSMS